MFESLIIAITGIVALMVSWIGIQHVWRRMFAEYISDEDVLAGRSSCGNCGCATACKRSKQSIEK